MAAIPLMEELSGSASSPMIAGIAGVSQPQPHQIEIGGAAMADTPRKLSIYAASAGFDLVDELDHLAMRAIEPNVFFNPRFLAPAMPRLEDREVFLAVMRDENDLRSRLRLLLPYSIEKPVLGIGSAVMRAWSSPFGPVGTPLIDSDDPVGTTEDFLTMLARPTLSLPGVLVMPDIMLDGASASVLRTAALARNLTVETVNKNERAELKSTLSGDEYFKAALKPHHFREFKRLRRRLGEEGELRFAMARDPDDIRVGCEAFLTLELMGWKGRERSAMASDRFQAAFAREAIDRLSEQDMVRVHTLSLDGNVIAAIIVFIERGIAYTWKTAYDEALAKFSPGTLLMMEATRRNLEDPNIQVTDSCAIPGHPVMERLWTERRQTGTLIIGLTPDADRAVRKTASQIHLYRETRNLARTMRRKVKSFIARR